MNYYNEFDPHAAAWLRELISENLIPQGHVDTRSITEVSPADLSGFAQCHFFAGIGGWPLALDLARWPADRPVWTGSCPCQPLSCAGQQKGHADERHLWPAFYRLIAECRPPTVFGEQVASRDGREWLAGVRADLEGVGYAVGAADLCAAGVGAPHIRQRLYWGAVRVADPHGRGRWTAGIAECVESVQDGAVLGGRETSERGPHGGSRGVADAERLHRGCEAGSSDHREPETDRSADWAGGRSGAPVRLEHSPGDGREQRGSEPGGRGAAGGCEACGVDDAPGSRREEHDGGQLLPGTVERCEAGGVGNALCGGFQKQPQRDGREIEPGLETPRRPDTDGPGFWSSSILLPCRDGKARRVEPTIFPLAHGVSGRVGLLRGSGNAIVAPLASTFIRAFLT